jgi:CDP-4-dehydro-6-deoxyglucose reductase, E1
MIPLMKNAFLNETKTKRALANFIIDAPRLSMGEQCFEFEKEFSIHQRCKDSVLFNSGGSANLAMVQALLNLGILKVGDKVGYSALTWSTNVMPIIQLGLIPVAIDCEATTLNVMSTQLLERIKDTPIKALFITNALGSSGDLQKIKEICDENKIVLFEDNCESLGTELETGRTGNFGVMASHSFFVAHHMSTIEGGMVCTNNSELAAMLRIVRANGWDRNLDADDQTKWRKKFNINSEFEAKYTFYDLGYNLRPTEITGFLGRNQLKFLDENIIKRNKNHRFFEPIVANNSDLVSLRYGHVKYISSFSFTVLCKTKELRNFYVSQFAGAGVEIRPVIAGNMQSQPFYSKYVKDKYDLPGTQFIHDCGFYFGNYPELNSSDLQVLKSCLTKI